MKKIGFIGASGVGKSTVASGLFHLMKINKYKVELIPELIKFKVFSDADFSRTGFDIQNTLEQQDLEAVFDKAGERSIIDFSICEAPLITGYIYSSYYNKIAEAEILKKIALDNINNYDILYFVNSIVDEKDFNTFGRKETFKQSEDIHKILVEGLESLNFKNIIKDIDYRVDLKTLLKDIEQL